MAAFDASVAPSVVLEEVTATAAQIADAASGDTPTPSPVPKRRRSLGRRIRAWLKTLSHNPTAEEIAMQERRRELLEELNRAVADAPDDQPIFEIIERLNHHRDD